MAPTLPKVLRQHILRAPILALAACLCTASNAVANTDITEKWSPWLELGGAYNNRDASRGEVGLFAPIMQGSHDLFFADIRGKLFQDDIKEGNFALGWRDMQTEGWNFGVWSGIDVRNTQAGSTFWQASGGVEALHPDWDIRANGYVPLNQTAFISQSTARTGFGDPFADVFGNEILLVTPGGVTTATNLSEQALWGVDGEVGIRLPLELLTIDASAPQFSGWTARHELRAYVGGFYFDADDIDAILGPRVRLEWRINDVLESLPGSVLRLETEYQYDDTRDHQFEVGLKLRIPFDHADARSQIAVLSAQERRMVEALERDTDIVTREKTETSISVTADTTENVDDIATDVALDRVAFADGSNNLQTVLDTAGPNSLIIAQGGAGSLGGGVAMQVNQTLLGGSGTIQVRGRSTGTVVGFTAPGPRPTIVETTNAVLTVADNSHVAHLNLRGNGGATLATNDGIVGGSSQRVVLDGLSVQGIGDNGIRFFSDNMVTISDVTLSNVDDEGIDFNDDNVVTIDDVVITNVNGSAIQFGDGNNVEIRAISVNNAGGDGIEFVDNNSFTIAGGTISNVGRRGINGNSNNTAVIRDLAISTTGTAGIRFNNDNSVVIERTSVSGTGQDGILVESNNRLTINNVFVADIGNQAIDLQGGNILSISNTVFAGNMAIDVFQFDAAGNQVVNSTGNVNNTTAIGGSLCDTLAGADFTGTISFVDGTVLQDNVAPCN